jgi:hypothetical protein
MVSDKRIYTHDMVLLIKVTLTEIESKLHPDKYSLIRNVKSRGNILYYNHEKMSYLRHVQWIQSEKYMIILYVAFNQSHFDRDRK